MNDVCMKVVGSKKSDEWETPQELFDSLNAEFHFTLDACASEENRKCEKYFSKENDGLQADWGGRECSVTLHTLKLRNGQRSASEKAGRTIRYVSC